MICKWFIITYLRGCFTLFHYFTLQDKYGWLIRIVWGIGYWQLDIGYWQLDIGDWQLDIGYGRLEKRKKPAKVLHETDKTCQFERKF